MYRFYFVIIIICAYSSIVLGQSSVSFNGAAIAEQREQNERTRNDIEEEEDAFIIELIRSLNEMTSTLYTYDISMETPRYDSQNDVYILNLRVVPKAKTNDLYDYVATQLSEIAISQNNKSVSMGVRGDVNRASSLNRNNNNSNDKPWQTLKLRKKNYSNLIDQYTEMLYSFGKAQYVVCDNIGNQYEAKENNIFQLKYPSDQFKKLTGFSVNNKPFKKRLPSIDNMDLSVEDAAFLSYLPYRLEKASKYEDLIKCDNNKVTYKKVYSDETTFEFHIDRTKIGFVCDSKEEYRLLEGGVRAASDDGMTISIGGYELDVPGYGDVWPPMELKDRKIVPAKVGVECYTKVIPVDRGVEITFKNREIICNGMAVSKVKFYKPLKKTDEDYYSSNLYNKHFDFSLEYSKMSFDGSVGREMNNKSISQRIQFFARTLSNKDILWANVIEGDGDYFRLSLPSDPDLYLLMFYKLAQTTGDFERYGLVKVE